MKNKSFVRESKREAYDILRRFKRRDFSGNTGQAIKNSTWQVMTTVVSKVSSLLFTLIIARMLMPELYGLYGLTLSIIVFLTFISRLGVDQALQTFMSRNIDKNKEKAKAFYVYLIKVKGILVLFNSLVVVSSAYIIASIYHKPIFLALLVGAIYIPVIMIIKILGILFTSRNNFKVIFFGEVILQTARLTILPLSIIFLLSGALENRFLLFWIFVALTSCYFVVLLYYSIFSYKKNPFKELPKTRELSKSEKSDLWNFIIPLSFMAFSGLFFGYVDTIMLGRYVTSEFIGFYQAAFNLITSISAIIAFPAISVIPIFHRIRGKQLERGFNKSFVITLLISMIVLLPSILFSSMIIKTIFGFEYSTAIIYFRILAVLILSFPLISLYQAYFTVQKDTKIMSVLLIVTTIINVILNYIFIKVGLSYGGYNYAVMGVCISTVISRYIYFLGLIVSRRIKYAH